MLNFLKICNKIDNHFNFEGQFRGDELDFNKIYNSENYKTDEGHSIIIKYNILLMQLTDDLSKCGFKDHNGIISLFINFLRWFIDELNEALKKLAKAIISLCKSFSMMFLELSDMWASLNLLVSGVPDFDPWNSDVNGLYILSNPKPVAESPWNGIDRTSVWIRGDNTIYFDNDSDEWVLINKHGEYIICGLTDDKNEKPWILEFRGNTAVREGLKWIYMWPIDYDPQIEVIPTLLTEEK